MNFCGNGASHGCCDRLRPDEKLLIMHCSPYLAPKLLCALTVQQTGSSQHMFSKVTIFTWCVSNTLLSVGCSSNVVPTSDAAPQSADVTGITIVDAQQDGVPPVGCTTGKCQPVVIAEKQPFPCYIAADESGVYWTTEWDPGKSDGRIKRYNPVDKKISDFVTEFVSPSALALDKDYVYWATSGMLATVQRANKTNGKKEILAQDEDDSDANLPRQMAVNNNAVYWVDFRTSELVRWSKQEKKLTVVSQPIGPSNVGLIADSVYVIEQRNDRLIEFPQVGDPVERAVWTCDKITGCSGGAAAYAKDFYWSLTMQNQHKGTIHRYNAEEKTTAVLADDQANPISVAADDKRVIWSNLGTSDQDYKDSQLVMYDLNKKTTSILADKQHHICGVAVYGGYAYWTSMREWKVYKLKLPDEIAN